MATTSSQLTQRDKTDLRDFRQEVTDNIVGMLERGVAPWQKPWEPGASSLGMPFNPASERAYRGGNAIHLMTTSLQRGYEDPRWMTYKQASENGWQRAVLSGRVHFRRREICFCAERPSSRMRRRYGCCRESRAK